MTRILLEAPPVVAPVPPPDPPDPPDPPVPPVVPTGLPPLPGPVHVPARVWELRADGVLLGTFAQQGVRTRRRNGAGEAVVTCSLDSALDPAASHLFSAGRPLTWRTSRLEVWVWRDGVIRHQGPVVAQSVDWEAETTTVRSWTREGYIQRLTAGMREPTEYAPRGRFDASLTGWSTVGSPSASASTQFTYGTVPRSMLLSGSSGSMQMDVYLTGDTAGNTLRWSIAVRMPSGATWWPDEIPCDVVHGHGGDLAVYPGILRKDEDRDTYHRVEIATPQRSGGTNTYVVRLYANPGGGARFGLVSARRWANVSSREGWDRATFAAATFAQVEEDDPSRPWSRLVDAAGSTWEGNHREMLLAHADYASMLGDLSAWGEWWVELGSHQMRWSPTRGGTSSYTLSPDRVSGLVTEVDGSKAATRVVVYADGQRYPTRDEGRAATSGGAVLDHAEQAPPGTDPRDLDVLAARRLADLGDAWSVAADPAAPPVVDGLPGDIQYDVQPGTRVPLSASAGVASMAETVRVEEERVDDVTDEVSWGVSLP